MTFKLSPGVYVLSSDSEQVDYSGSPIALVGSFRKGSLTPTRIRYGENSDRYDLSNTNSQYGYSTEVARHVASTNNLVIKRVVSKTARTATKSLLKNSDVSLYAQMHYDAAGNLLEPVAIFFNSEIVEDYKVIITIHTTDNFTCSAEAKWSTTHNAVVESLAAQLKEQLQAHNQLYIVEYDNLAEQIPAILVYPPHGYRIDGSVEVILDLLPMSNEEKIAILNEYIEDYRINPNDRAPLDFHLRTTTYYKRKEIEAYLNTYIIEHYLSASLVEARLSYYVAQHMLREKDKQQFYYYLAGREKCLHDYDELDALFDEFKSKFYLSQQAIMDYTEAQVGTLITEASVNRLKNEVYIPNKWLYANTTEVRSAIVAWADVNLMSVSTKAAWVNQYIAQDKIRSNDFDDALSYINVPTDDVIGIQHNLDAYCLVTYLSQDEKDAMINSAIQSGTIEQSDFDNVVHLTSYLIRKDEAYLMLEVINLYASSKTLTISEIQNWITYKVNDGLILQEDRVDFERYLVNESTLVYVYHNYDELEAKYNDYASANYLTADQGKEFVQAFVGTTITQSDADAIKATITAKVCKQSSLQAQINTYASKYMTTSQIESYIEGSFNVLPGDVDTLVALFDGELIDNTSVIDTRVNEWLAANYMSQSDFSTFATGYTQNQSVNAILLLDSDVAKFADWAASQATPCKKGDSICPYNKLIDWAGSYYIAKADLEAAFVSVAASRDFPTDAYEAWAASSYCNYELYTDITAAEADMNAYIDNYASDQLRQYINANYTGNALYQVLATAIDVSNGKVAADPEDPTKVYADSDTTIDKPFVVDSTTQEGDIVFKQYASLNEALTALDAIGTTYLSWSQFDSVLQSNVKYNKCTTAEKETIFDLAWYAKFPDDPKLEAYPCMMYTSTDHLNAVLNGLADAYHTLQVEYYCFRFIDSGSLPRYLYTKSLSLTTSMALYGYKGAADSDIMSIPVSTLSGMQLLGTGEVDGASGALYTITSVDTTNNTLTLEDTSSTSFTATRVSANDVHEDW